MKKALLILALPLIQFAATNAFAADDAMHDSMKSMHDNPPVMKSAPALKPGEAEGIAITKMNAPTSDKTRQEVKAETKAAANAGELPKAGEAVMLPVTERKPVSTKSRAAVKAKAKKEGPLKPVEIGEDTTHGK
jgi:hypothetical protein